MKLSVSNIAWNSEDNKIVYKYLKQNNYNGLEIAPTALIGENPYDNIQKAQEIVKNIKENYNLDISSMQSIWFGKKGNIFNEKEAKDLLVYTKKAIDFAKAINCKNLVFGCPKNRTKPSGATEEDIIYFFKEIGDYAEKQNTTLSIEPNPTLYGTNFINTTTQAFDFVKKVNSKGLMVNVDFGTIIENNESLDTIFENIKLVNHIHISEPNLLKIEQRNEHKELIDKLKNLNYDKHISIEMKKTDSVQDLLDSISYIRDLAKDE